MKSHPNANKTDNNAILIGEGVFKVEEGEQYWRGHAADLKKIV